VKQHQIILIKMNSDDCTRIGGRGHRTTKDPYKPPNSYMLFCVEQRNQQPDKYKGITSREATSRLAEEWKITPNELKNQYKLKFQVLKEQLEVFKQQQIFGLEQTTEFPNLPNIIPPPFFNIEKLPHLNFPQINPTQSLNSQNINSQTQADSFVQLPTKTLVQIYNPFGAHISNPFDCIQEIIQNIPEGVGFCQEIPLGNITKKESEISS
jgi:hypothetical protein